MSLSRGTEVPYSFIPIGAELKNGTEISLKRHGMILTVENTFALM